MTGWPSIAARVRAALSDDPEAAQWAISEIAGAMQLFLTSDVIHETRTFPVIRAALAEAEVGGQTIQRSEFLPGIEWLATDPAAEALGQPPSSRRRREPGRRAGARPPRHGARLRDGRRPDAPTRAPNRIPTTERDFIVTFTNQGEIDETNIQVVLRIEGARRPDPGRPARSSPCRRARRREATLALTEAPPLDQPVTIRVEVRPVPGEDVGEHSSEYEAIFVQQ